MRVDRHETETATWEVATRPPPIALRPYLLESPAGWVQARGDPVQLREVPFPGIPLVFNLGEPWEIDDEPDAHRVPERHDSFLGGLHTGPAVVRGAGAWACVELRLTPLGTHRLLGMPMHELANRTVALEDLLPDSGELIARLRETRSWTHRFELIETFLLRRLVDATAPSPGVEWSWEQLRRTHGLAPIGTLADELGWSHRRLIARFRDQIGLAPKTLARVIRFDGAVGALRRRDTRNLAEIALDCGYFDQAHLNRDFRELAGTTPTSFLAAQLESGGVAA